MANIKDPELHPNFRRAFRKSSRWWRSLFMPNPAGCGRSTYARLEKVLEDSNANIQKLKDEYTNPSGEDNVEAAIEGQALEGSKQPDFSQVEAENTLQNNAGQVTTEN